MKRRNDHVTNSSSSSFIITNNTDETITSTDVIKSLFAKILQDAECRFVLMPGESIEYECSDEDGEPFELFIHNVVDGYTWSHVFGDGKVSVKFLESHH